MDPMNPMPADRGPAPRMRASDADRDRVLAELSEHFQAGRLTTDEMQERTGTALAARTVGELSDLMSDLPALHPAAPPAPAAPLAAPARRLPVAAGVVAALAVLAVVLVVALDHAGHHVGGAGFGALIPILIIVRVLAGGRGPAGRRRY
jgi:Domain of unknown function (DUF1707)